jgi:hypothetical protein
MTDTERISLVLKKVVERSPEYLYINVILEKEGDKEPYSYTRVAEYLQQNALANIIDGNRAGANNKSFEIEKIGGYDKYLELESIKEKKAELKAQWEFRSLQAQTILNEWLIWSKWWPHAFSVIALILAIISFFR